MAEKSGAEECLEMERLKNMMENKWAAVAEDEEPKDVLDPVLVLIRDPDVITDPGVTINYFLKYILIIFSN